MFFILILIEIFSEPISDGITTSKYPSPEEILLSFKQNSHVKIFGKTSDNHFYFAEVI